MNKKIILACAVLAAAAILTGCSKTENSGNSANSGGSSSSATSAVSQSPSEKTTKLLTEVEFPEMVEVSADKLEVYFGISADKVDDFSVYICGSGAMPDEFGIFLAKDASAAAEIEQLLKDRIDYQTETYRDYTPQEAYKLEDSFVSVSGNTVIYAICADNTKAGEILE